MRLGEQKNIIDRVINDDNQIVIDHSPLYGGQAQKISNFGEVLDALEILSELEWNTQDYSQVEALIEKYGKTRAAQIESAEFNSLNSYISTLNQELPFYYSILETMVGEQDEKTINIKLPTRGVSSLKELATLNNRLDKILKQFNVDGQFEFHGFDRGSDWYVVVATGVLSPAFLLACLEIAKAFFETREAYYNSEKARLDYKASLKKGEQESEDDFKDYTEKRKELELENSVHKAVDQMGTGSSGKSPEELKTQLIKATTELVKELEKGTEFHLSLNPPSYAEDHNSGYSIDYQKVRDITRTEEDTPALESGEKENTNNTSEEDE